MGVMALMQRLAHYLFSNVHLQNKLIVHLHTIYLFHLLHFLELSPHSIYTVNVFKAIH